MYGDTIESYDAGHCKGIIMPWTDAHTNAEHMREICDRNMVSTGSLVLEVKVGWPVRNANLGAGMSYWITKAAEDGISYDTFLRQSTNALCNMEIDLGDSEGSDLVAFAPKNMFFPIIFYLIC